MKIQYAPSCPFCSVVEETWWYMRAFEEPVDLWSLDLIICKRCGQRIELTTKTRYSIKEGDWLP